MCIYSETLSLLRVFFLYIKFDQIPKTKDQSEKTLKLKESY